MHAHEFEEFRPGDRVRSFDFANPPMGYRDLTGPRAYFVEGVIEAVGRFPDIDPSPCRHYKIRVERRVWAGEEVDDFPPYVYPPVNGVPIWGDTNALTCGVEKI